MESLSRVYFFTSIFLVYFIANFECATKNDEDSDLNSEEQKYYDALEPASRAPWLRGMLKKKLREINQKLSDVNLDREFGRFMCAMNLLRLTIEIAILVRLEETEARFQPPDFSSLDVKTLIKELLPQAEEKILDEAYDLFERYYRCMYGSESKLAKAVRSSLFSNSYEVWECAAVAAAVKMLSNCYKYYNGSQAVIIQRAILENDPLPFPDIVCKYSSWNLQERHIKILNILFSNVGEYPIGYKQFTLKNGENVVLPMHDPYSARTACL